MALINISELEWEIETCSTVEIDDTVASAGYVTVFDNPVKKLVVFRNFFGASEELQREVFFESDLTELAANTWTQAVEKDSWYSVYLFILDTTPDVDSPATINVGEIVYFGGIIGNFYVALTKDAGTNPLTPEQEDWAIATAEDWANFYTLLFTVEAVYAFTKIPDFGYVDEKIDCHALDCERDAFIAVPCDCKCDSKAVRTGIDFWMQIFQYYEAAQIRWAENNTSAFQKLIESAERICSCGTTNCNC